MRVLCIISCVLLIIGGLNWGIIGVTNFNVLEAIFGQGSVLTSVIYTLVGISAIYSLVTWSQEKKMKKRR